MASTAKKPGVRAVPEAAEVDIDLDAMRAARTEASDGPLRVRWGGEVFEILPALEWPYEALERVERNDFPGAIREALGDEAWERFVAHKPRLADIRDLFTSLARASGFESLGE